MDTFTVQQGAQEDITTQEDISMQGTQEDITTQVGPRNNKSTSVVQKWI